MLNMVDTSRRFRPITLTLMTVLPVRSGQRELCTPVVRGRREFEVELTANSEEPNIFSPSIFWRTHSNYAS
jgi:hypothetical protein